MLTLLGDRKERYGRIRLWGTIGYGVMAPFAGSLIGRLGLKWAFWGYAILMLGGLLVITRIPFRQSQLERLLPGRDARAALPTSPGCSSW